VFVAKYYSIGDLYMITLDLLYIWTLYRQIWISGTNKDMNVVDSYVGGALFEFGWNLS
jgi:hypothetical protein